MKAAFLLFAAIAIAGIGWGYIGDNDRATVRRTVRANLLPIIGAMLLVAMLIFFSINTSITLI